MDPIFWLGLSILLVAISIAAVLLTMIPALKELGRAAQGAEKLFDTLNRELPPTLEAIRLTSLELTELTDDMTDSIQSVGQVAQQVDSSVTTAKAQTQQVAVTTKSLTAGFKAAWQTLTNEAATEAMPETITETMAEVDAESPETAEKAEVSPERLKPSQVAAQDPTANVPLSERAPIARSTATPTNPPDPATPKTPNQPS